MRSQCTTASWRGSRALCGQSERSKLQAARRRTSWTGALALPFCATANKAMRLNPAFPPWRGRSSDETRRQRLIAPIPLPRGPVHSDYRPAAMMRTAGWDFVTEQPGEDNARVRRALRAGRPAHLAMPRTTPTIPLVGRAR